MKTLVRSLPAALVLLAFGPNVSPQDFEVPRSRPSRAAAARAKAAKTSEAAKAARAREAARPAPSPSYLPPPDLYAGDTPPDVTAPPPPDPDPAPRPLRVTFSYEEPTSEPLQVPSDGGWLAGFRFRAGGMSIAPTGRGEVRMENVSGMARLSGMTDGPISRSYTTMGNVTMPTVFVGYALPVLDRQLSIETILGTPVKQKVSAHGRLADESLGPYALGALPTGVPPLGPEIGEVTALPPVVTVVYRFFPRSRFRPYLGAGGTVMVPLKARITNKVMTSVREPRFEVDRAYGWVVQAGGEVRVGSGGWAGRIYLTADVKYMSLEVTSRVRDIWILAPGLPLFGPVKVGDNVARTKINPILTFVGVGMDL